MDYIENTDTQSVKKFTKKFITNYIIGAILIGIVVGVISEILSAFLPTQFKTIANFLITILGLWKISSSAVETSSKETNITSDNIKAVLKNICIFLIILLVINIIFSYISVNFSAKILSSLKGTLLMNFAIQSIATTIQYVVIMMFCKNKLEQIVLGKEINKSIYIVLLVIASVILIIGSFVGGNTSNESTGITTIKDSELATKYENANWEKVGCSNSTTVDFNVASVHVKLGHFNKDTIEKYKVVKIICTIYKKSTNEVIGTSESYYEDVELEYGFFSFSKIISVKLSTPFVGNDFSSKIEAYGVKE